MKVHELISLLETFPPDMDVSISDHPDNTAWEISRVYDIDDFVCVEAG